VAERHSLRGRVRFAILFSGMPFRRHINGLEFCYRTLIERLGFAAENIHALSYDRSLRSSMEMQEVAPSTTWLGDGTHYRMKVTGEGSRAGFKDALQAIGSKLKADDQLFINITGSGGNHGNGRGPDLIVYPHARRYRCVDFCADLAILPPCRSLVVLMSQCFSGGFNHAVLSASRAESTFIASAAAETNPSFTLPDDLNWDSFQRNFVAGLGGYDVNGTPVSRATRHCARRLVTVGEALEFAVNAPVRSPYDSPEFAANPQSAVNMTLGEDTALQSPRHIEWNCGPPVSTEAGVRTFPVAGPMHPSDQD
jgi:hypothetical protein